MFTKKKKKERKTKWNISSVRFMRECVRRKRERERERTTNSSLQRCVLMSIWWNRLSSFQRWWTSNWDINEQILFRFRIQLLSLELYFDWKEIFRLRLFSVLSKCSSNGKQIVWYALQNDSKMNQIEGNRERFCVAYGWLYAHGVCVCVRVLCRLKWGITMMMFTLQRVSLLFHAVVPFTILFRRIATDSK